MDKVRTADGKTVREGERVFDYYNGAWGTVGTVEDDGWFTFTSEAGRKTSLNGERVCVVIPRGNPFYKTHGEGK